MGNTQMPSLYKPMRLDARGLKFLTAWEGKRNSAYLDLAGIPTIGVGFIKYAVGSRRGQDVKLGDTLTDEEINAELAAQVWTYEAAVNSAVTVPLTQSQFNALVSLCYNIGSAAFKRSTVLKELNKQRYQAACAAFAMWNKAGGKIRRGLSNRRAAEQDEFFRMG